MKMKTIIGKMVVLGKQNVGKTSMIVRYVENNFNPYITPTIGASFFLCKVKVEEVVVKIQIWDTAGQERFKAMAPMFYRNANAAMLVFDITDPGSFEDMKQWVTELKRNVEEPMFLCVVGNKIDLVDKRKVPRDEAIQYSKTIGASYYESSALTNQGLEQIFYNTAVGLMRLSDDNLVKTLKIYVGDDDLSNIMARSSELNATDVGTVETVNLGIDSIAHGNTVKSNCC